ncbi:MAG: CPBP family intramembrane metalloprotease [Candidatus Kapabacteria bacterium]|nr:CPBP family intramembrane metalloprotease [Ignavibacteriota bacterium]MCW5883543.1 CPBP family intramembrane metalloprotease [Candidatus Kapabacteria bacterium]
MNFELKPLGIVKSALIFIFFTIILYFACWNYLPFLIRKFGAHPVLAWHISGGIVFVMLFSSAFAAFLGERAIGLRQSFWERFRIKKLDKTDWKWSLWGLLALYVSSGLVFFAESSLISNFSTNPAFMEMPPIKPNEWWLLLTWLIMFFFNIVGEEIFWRGYMFPKQRIVLGKYTWIVNSAGWMLFHLAFGWQMMIMLIPTIVIIPYIMQKRDNTTIGIFLHGVFNGLSYLAITLSSFFS